MRIQTKTAVNRQGANDAGMRMAVDANRHTDIPVYPHGDVHIHNCGNGQAEKGTARTINQQ